MGYAVVEEADGEVSALAWGVLAPPPREHLGQRLHLIHSGLSDLMNQWTPHEVAIEEPFVSKNPRTALAIGQAQGVALIAAASRGIQAVRYSPRQVKQTVTGYGSATKEQVQQLVAMQFGIDGSDIPEDAADALAIVLCHLRARTEAQVLAQG